MSFFPQTPQQQHHHNNQTNNAGAFSSPANGSDIFATPKSDMSNVGPKKGASTYKPIACRIGGEKLVCLVNASVTVIPGDREIYVFGGFDQYTDEVYNHVLRLDIAKKEWELIDNYGDIPCVRMGHTTTYWKNQKLISFGGENDVRMHLSDVFLFDIPTATWSRPPISGIPPDGRSRHAVTLYDDKLFIVGGVRGEHEVIDDMCYLDLRTWTWSKTWKFVARFDHQCWVADGKLWVFGGLTPQMDRTGELAWLDLTDLSGPGGRTEGLGASLRPAIQYTPVKPAVVKAERTRAKTRSPVTSGSIKFKGGTYVPWEPHGTHFHHICSSTLLDFVTPAPTISPANTSISALDLKTLTWTTLVRGAEAFAGVNYRWYYLAISPTSSNAYLIGSDAEDAENESLSVILPIDLKHYGITPGAAYNEEPKTGTLGGDVGSLLDKAQQQNSQFAGDFAIYGLKDEACVGDEDDGPWAAAISSPSTPQSGIPFGGSANGEEQDSHLPPSQVRSPAVFAHKLILLSRWPHFSTLLSSQMAEFHSGKLYIPEPYSVIKSFVNYLYTDSIAPSKHTPNLSVVAGLLPLANMYCLPRLRALIVDRITKELDIDSAAVVWERARVAGEDDLRKRAAAFCLSNWGRVVRTKGFKNLGREGLWELCAEVDLEGRVVAGGLDGGMSEAGDESEEEEAEEEDDDFEGEADAMDGVVGN